MHFVIYTADTLLMTMMKLGKHGQLGTWVMPKESYLKLCSGPLDDVAVQEHAVVLACSGSSLFVIESLGECFKSVQTILDVHKGQNCICWLTWSQMHWFMEEIPGANGF